MFTFSDFSFYFGVCLLMITTADYANRRDINSPMYHYPIYASIDDPLPLFRMSLAFISGAFLLRYWEL